MSLKVVTSENFEQEVLSSKKPVIVDVYADWCGPCKAIAPILEALSVELDEEIVIVKINADQSNELVKSYGVRSIPTLLYFEDGKVVREHVGAATRSKIVEFINRN